MEGSKAVETAQTVWEQQKLEMNQQNSSLQNQIKAFQGQVSSLTHTINSEKQRQEVAIAAKLESVKKDLSWKIDVEISWAERNTIHEGKPYDAKAALAYVQSVLPTFIR